MVSFASHRDAVACAPALSSPLTRAEAQELAAVVKALAVPARLQILSLLRSQPDAEAAACQFVDTIGLSQPTISHHLKVLHEAGLLERERRGPCIYYRLPPDRMASICRALI